eukprot:g83095.t1
MQATRSRLQIPQTLTPRMREWITECLQGGVEMSDIKEALVYDYHELFRLREHIGCRAFFPADMFRDFVRIQTSLLQLDKDDLTATSKFLTQTELTSHQESRVQLCQDR